MTAASRPTLRVAVALRPRPRNTTAVSPRCLHHLSTSRQTSAAPSPPSTVLPSSVRHACHSLRPSGARFYHNYDHPRPPAAFGPDERAILSAALAAVPEHGFTEQALVRGARAAGYRDISTNLLPDGVFSLIRWHLVTQREGLAARGEGIFAAAEAERGDGKKLGVGAKVELLTWERLMGNRGVIQRWQEALAIMAQPSYAPGSLEELAQLADEIWFLAGDTAVDPSWYTKRGSLAAIYGATELFMTNDASPGFAETRRFLRRRIDETQELAGALRSVAEWVGFTGSAAVNVLRSKGVRI